MARRAKEMNKEDGTEQPWGTLEELLLACAVNRHGPKSWDSIATELQRRSSHHRLRAFYSPPNCKRKFHDLRRRFAFGRDGGDGGGAGGDDVDEDERMKTMVDELKKLRVAELRLEVERRGVSIEFLELKVKRLEEEREQSLKPKEEVIEEGTDLPKEPDDTEPVGNNPSGVAGRSVPCEESDDRDNRSFNESNSTSNQKCEDRGGDEPELKHEPEERDSGIVKPEISKSGPGQTDSKQIPDCSLPLKLDGDEKADSVAESKREAVKEVTKQSGEVQSSRKKKRRARSRLLLASSSGDDEPEESNGISVSPAASEIATKSQPLIKSLVLLRSHKNGSLFERRLPSQETDKYKKMIRQHMDLQTVQSRLDQGFYLDSVHKFFRDLLLLFNNAAVFFPNNSPENTAARELRELVAKEISTTIPTPPKPEPKPQKSEPAPKSTSSFEARTTKEPAATSPPPIVVCRRRKPSEVHKVLLTEKKLVKKQGFKERSDQLSRGSSRNGSKIIHRRKQSDHDDEEEKLENSSKKEITKKKKNLGTSYLKRTRQKEDNDTEDEEEERNDGRRDTESRKGEGGKRGGREGTNDGGKRGRPPRRSPVGVDARRDGGRGKKGREGSEAEVVVTEDSGRSRKRSKR